MDRDAAKVRMGETCSRCFFLRGLDKGTIIIRPQLEIMNEYAGSIWRYVYDHPSPGNPMGCFHASELPVLFGAIMLGIDGTEDGVGVTMRTIWGRFAKEGDPGWEARTARLIR